MRAAAREEIYRDLNLWKESVTNLPVCVLFRFLAKGGVQFAVIESKWGARVKETILIQFTSSARSQTYFHGELRPKLVQKYSRRLFII